MDYTGYSKNARYRKFTNQWNWFVPCIKSQVFWTRLAWRLGMDSYESHVRYQEGRLMEQSWNTDGDHMVVMGLLDRHLEREVKTPTSTRKFADHIWRQISFWERDELCLRRSTRQQAVERFLAWKDRPGCVIRPESDKKGNCFIRLKFYGYGGSELIAARIEGEERVRKAQLATAEHLADYLAAWWASPYRGLLSRPGRQPMVVGDPSMLGTNGGCADFSSLYAADPGEFYLPE